MIKKLVAIYILIFSFVNAAPAQMELLVDSELEKRGESELEDEYRIRL